MDRVRRQLEKLASVGVDGATAVAENLARSFGVVGIDNVAVPRLRLGQDLNDYWVDSVLGGKAHVGGLLTGGQARLAHAADFFDSALATLVDGVGSEVAVARLRELQRRVTAGLRVLVYEVSSSAEVGVIFETLNERGRPLLEVVEAIEVLAGGGPSDIVELTLALAREMLALVGLDAMAVGVAAWRLGAGRARKEDDVSPIAGVSWRATVGDPVIEGQPLLELHLDDASRLAHALEGAIEVSPTPVAAVPLILGRVT